MIEARGLTKRYGDVVAVDDLTFTVEPGVVTGFLGPNGAGKSTTMRMVMGLDRPSGGSVTVGGQDISHLAAPMRTIGAMLDAKAVHPQMTARAHLRWLAQAGGIGLSKVDEVLGVVGLTKAAERRVGGFSLGMHQRLGIAAALLGDPRTLLLDEPMNGLDPEGIKWIRGLMKGLAAEGRTVFVSSHLLSEMQATVDSVLVIGQGRFIAHMSVDELTKRDVGYQVNVISPEAGKLKALLTKAGATVADDPAVPGTGLLVTGVSAARVGDLAAEHRIRLHELTPRQASLEAAFFGLTGESVSYRGTEATGAGDQTPTANVSKRSGI